MQDDLEYVKPSRTNTRRSNATLKAVREPMFKMQVVDSKKERKPRFKTDYTELTDSDYDEYV